MNLYRKIEYKFSDGWHGRVVVVLVWLATLVALWNTVGVLLSLVPSSDFARRRCCWNRSSAYRAGCFAPVIKNDYKWQFLRSDNWPDSMGPFVIFVISVSVKRKRGANFFPGPPGWISFLCLIFAALVASVVYFASQDAAASLFLAALRRGVAGLLAICIALSLRGNQLDRRARDPLHGILDPPSPEEARSRPQSTNEPREGVVHCETTFTRPRSRPSQASDALQQRDDVVGEERGRGSRPSRRWPRAGRRCGRARCGPS